MTEPMNAPETPELPRPRGPLSAFIADALRLPAHELEPAPAAADAPLDGEDFQLSLYLLYELHYRGFAGVDELWEWNPSLMALRAGLERAFEGALRHALPPEPDPVAGVAAYLTSLLTQADGPSLSRFIETRASLDQF